MSRKLARQISRDFNTVTLFCNGFNRWFLLWFRAHNVRKVRVVKYIFVYGQIKAADEKYGHNQKWRRKL